MPWFSSQSVRKAAPSEEFGDSGIILEGTSFFALQDVLSVITGTASVWDRYVHHLEAFVQPVACGLSRSGAKDLIWVGIEEYIQLCAVLLLDMYFLYTITSFIYCEFVTTNSSLPFLDARSCFRA